LKKAVVIVDGGYFDGLNFYLLNNRKKKIDVEKLSNKVCENVTHLRTYFYHAFPFRGKPPTPEQEERYRGAQRFFHSINTIRNHEFVEVGRVLPHYLSCPKCGGEFVRPRQKGVDVGIALELVRMADQHVADVFILISGDEDLTRAVELAKSKLANVIVYYAYDPTNKLYGSRKLNNAADERHHMDLEFLEGCALV
jgi:uncharacterized LabA/DUF88 family protein